MTRKQRFQNVGAGKGVKEQLDRAALEQLYVRERLTQAQIALRFNCSPQFVSRLLREHDIRKPT